jgi:ribonuclease I
LVAELLHDGRPTQIGGNATPGDLTPSSFMGWPQFERGFPSDCKTEVQRVPDDLVIAFRHHAVGRIDRHQWRRHGSCSGLAMEDYFSTLRAARDKVVILADYRRPDVARSVDPKDVEAAFMQAIPVLRPTRSRQSASGGIFPKFACA